MPRPVLRLATLIPLLAALSACNEPRTVMLVNLPALELREEHQFGKSDDANKSFSYVSAIDVADDGTVYIADSKEGHIRIFDSTAHLLATFGRPGEGPGEFKYVEALGVLGDSVWVRDRQARRFSYFSRSGRYLGQATLGTAQIGTGRLYTWVFAAIPRRNHTFVSVPNTSAFSTDMESDSIRVPTLLFDTAGRVVDTLGWSVQHELRAVRLGSAALRPMMYSPYARMVDADTLRFEITQRVMHPDEAWLRIARIDDRNKELSSRGYSYAPELVTKERIDARVASFTKAFFEKDGVIPPGSAEQVRAGLMFPEHLPLVGRVIAGNDGTLWCARNGTPEGDPPKWIVIGADGKVRGEVSLPKGAAVQTIRVLGDRVWVPVDDDSGLWVAQYRLVSPASPK